MIYQHDLQSKELFEQVKSMPIALRDKYMNDLSHLSTQNVQIHSIRGRTERMLWHQRLEHPSDKYLYRAHKFVRGVPKFQHEVPVLTTCSTCIEAKQVKSAPGENTTLTAKQPFQGLSLDFMFSGMQSKNRNRRTDFLGYNGETSAIVVLDHFTGQLYGDARMSKATPIHWIRHFLDNHKATCENKYVFMDQGGELYHNPEVRKLFKLYGYTVNPTGSDTSR